MEITLASKEDFEIYGCYREQKEDEKAGYLTQN